MEILTIPLQTQDYTQDEALPENCFAGMASVFGGIVNAYIPTVIHKGAFTKTLSEQANRVKILWQHNDQEPIGVPTSMVETDQGLAVRGKISLTQRGRDALQLLRDGVINGLSIGFDPVKENIEKRADGSMLRHIREVKLWEFSLVTWGADGQALITEVNKAQIQGVLEHLGATSYANLPLADRARAWDSSAAESRIRSWSGATDAPNAKYRRAFMWFDGQHSDEFGAYKLPYADVIDGKLVAIPRAIFAIAAVLQGSRGGTSIPDVDQEHVKGHVEKYYAKMRTSFDDDAIVVPWKQGVVRASDVEEADFLYLLGSALVTGSMNLTQLKEALQLAPGVESQKALTPASSASSNIHIDSILMAAELDMQVMLLAEP